VTYYSECPVCDSLGPKSINHIKQCANKRSIDPKRLLQMLKGCKKSILNHKSKNSNPKPLKKSNKNFNNYVITFEQHKPLKLSVNPLSVSHNKSVKPVNYELSLLDIRERQILLESKISDEILCNVATNFASQQDIDKVLLPNLWQVSLLQSESSHYIVQDFDKYNNS